MTIFPSVASPSQAPPGKATTTNWKLDATPSAAKSSILFSIRLSRLAQAGGTIEID
jgi:hypothetical protein